jgi:hypothetical protein
MSNSELSWADYRGHRIYMIVNVSLFASLTPEPTIYAGRRHRSAVPPPFIFSNERPGNF